ncbi:hypothetical protein ACLOJK_031550 [Asimina triloba]
MAASRCFCARKLVNGGGLTNARRACRSSNLLSHLDRCSGVHRLSGPASGCGVIGREYFLRGSSSFDALRGCYALSSGNAERERMGGVKRYSFYKHLNGFLSDSSLSRWRGGSDESAPSTEIFCGSGSLEQYEMLVDESVQWMSNANTQLHCSSSTNSDWLQKRKALFSTSTGDMTGLKQVGLGKLTQDKPVKKESEEQVADVKMLRTLAKYLWLKDNLEFRMRVLMALGLLVGAKVLNVQVPFLFKLAVDWLSTVSGSANTLASFTAANSTLIALFVSPAAVLVGYGIARAGASACNGIVFSHLHELDLKFHLSRQTGALNRIIDRGSRAINFILSSMVFNVVPTVLEISMVSGILAYKFGAPFAWITSLSVAAYVAFTLTVTQWRTKFRQVMNKADNDASSRAIDSLINYETVKYFNNEHHEVQKYDEFLKRFWGGYSLQHFAPIHFEHCLIVKTGLIIELVKGLVRFDLV